MLIVNVTQTKVLLALAPEEFSELFERARATKSAARRVLLTTAEPVPAVAQVSQ